jgi:diguanylate cyclase (GGDEF)-like protein/PAS domain S-box-containing protein
MRDTLAAEFQGGGIPTPTGKHQEHDYSLNMQASSGTPKPGGTNHLSAIIEGNPVASFVIDCEHRVTHWNRACAALTGIAAADMIGTKRQWSALYPTKRPVMADLIVDGDRAGLDVYFAGQYRASELIPEAFEAEDFFPALGSMGRWLFITAAPLHDAEGRLLGAVETLQDITERRRADAALREGQALLAQIIDGSPVATFVLDLDHRVTHWNRACEALTGVSADLVLGTRDQWKAFYNRERPVMADLILDGGLQTAVDQYYSGHSQPSALIEGAYEAEDFFPAFGEHGRWVYFTAAPLRDSRGEIIGAMETLQDITARKDVESILRENEEQYRLMSQTDSLTGLFNSRHFFDRLGCEIDRAERYRRPLALLAMDADNFKHVNDTYGHLEGDHVLQTLASVIRDSLRRTDSGYRYGGEEFMVLMPEASLEGAARVAERIRSSFAAIPMLTDDGQRFTCSVSIGVVSYSPGDSPNSLVRRGDKGMYRAKQRGKNCCVVVEAD